MGVVYRARHAQLGRDFAIKTIHSDKASDKDFALRFRREAEAIAKIDHPNIVSVADFVEGDPAKGEISYIVMEYLKGKDLGRIIKEGGPLEITRAVDRILEVCAAVSTCHRRGYVHRDLKPTNIFITASDFIEVAKVLDFGVAKAWAEDQRKEPQDEELTKKGTVFGTPEYIAPELLKDRSASPKSDQYSIGVVLFYALTGRKPFIGDPKAAVPDLDLWMSVSKGIHPSPRSLRSDIPEQLEAVIERAMSVSPEARLKDVHELGAHLLPWASPAAHHRWTQLFTSAPVAINLQVSIAIDAHTRDSSVPPRPSTAGATIRDKPEQDPTIPLGTEELKGMGEESAASARRPVGTDAPSVSLPISVDESTAAPSPTTTGAAPRSSVAAFLRRPIALVLGGGLLLMTALVVAAVLHRSRPEAPVGATPPPALGDHPAPPTLVPPAAPPPPRSAAPPVEPSAPPPAAPVAAPGDSRPAPARRPGHKRPRPQVDQEGFPIPPE
jgi:serine/threonine-protein kinase